MSEKIVQVLMHNEVVGLLMETNRGEIIFQYNDHYIDHYPSLNPLTLPAKKGVVFKGYNEPLFEGLPPCFADSLPDKWGKGLFFNWLKANPGAFQNKFGKPSVLDFLMFTADRAIGALEYRPSLYESNTDEILLSDIENFISGYAHSKQFSLALPKLSGWEEVIRIGSSVGGRNPKALVNISDDGNTITSGVGALHEGFTPYIIKFYPSSDLPIVRIEFAYYLMAKELGINMMPSKIFLDTRGNPAFLTQRFDRDKKGEKIHVQSFAAMMPYSSSYEEMFQVARKLQLPQSDVNELFSRVVFNVHGCNVDDHNKNFSFVMDKNGSWRLSPAYDILFSFSPEGWSLQDYHELSINGKVKNITDDDLLKLGLTNDVQEVKQRINHSKEVTSKFNCYGAKAGIESWISDLISTSINEGGSFRFAQKKRQIKKERKRGLRK